MCTAGRRAGTLVVTLGDGGGSTGAAEGGPWSTSGGSADGEAFCAGRSSGTTAMGDGGNATTTGALLLSEMTTGTGAGVTGREGVRRMNAPTPTSAARAPTITQLFHP